MKGRPDLGSEHLLPAWYNQRAALNLVDVDLAVWPRAAVLALYGRTIQPCSKALRLSPGGCHAGLATDFPLPPALRVSVGLPTHTTKQRERERERDDLHVEVSNPAARER